MRSTAHLFKQTFVTLRHKNSLFIHRKVIQFFHTNFPLSPKKWFISLFSFFKELINQNKYNIVKTALLAMLKEFI